MQVHNKLGLGNGLEERSTSIRELTADELRFVAGGEGGGGGGGEGGGGGGGE